jgi:hypothetical protein
MNGRVLANAAVFVLGLVLIIGGAWGIWRGSDYIQLERGWASVISGSVAATGGVLTLTVGFVLRRLDALHSAFLNAGARGVGLLSEAPVVAEAAEPMPLGLEPTHATPALAPQARSHEPEAVTPTPSSTMPDPALAAAAVNVELLAHEARHAEEEEHPSVERTEGASAEPDLFEAVPTEAVPEAAHRAGPSPAEEMAKAAGVGDEPELDAAIEELLAEERGGRPPPAAVEDHAPAVSGETPAESEPLVPVAPEARETVPKRTGWRGLFSRKERPAATPIPPDGLPAPELSSFDQSEPVAHATEPEAAAEQDPRAPQTDSIPRTGDDWFDRALSGVDEVEPKHAPSEQGTSGAVSGADQSGDMAGSQLGFEAPKGQRPSAGAPPPAEPAVIGRYTSGNTTYIMFADGSIEAETPTGILHFASLADLKVYVEGGQ